MKGTIQSIRHEGVVFLLLVIPVSVTAAQDRDFTGTKGPAAQLSVILGRPTDHSITLSILSAAEVETRIEYGLQSGRYTGKTDSRISNAQVPVEFELDSLKPNARYHYRLLTRLPGNHEFRPQPEGTFHTARSFGSPFTFTITADSHLDGNTDPLLYERTLVSARADGPDFHIDLGDTFMTEKHPNRDSAIKQYLAQRYYFGRLCDAAPLFLVLGNHDGEFPRGGKTEADSSAVWSNLMRNRYFPNPVPNGFYTGNENKHPEAGFLEDYYAWEWGDALFVVLDPYWYNARVRGNRDNWSCSLGLEQYQWLRRTLERSHAKFKFVFIHQLVGGSTQAGRGGVEAAPFFEWGGKSDNAIEDFQTRRPGWPEPIHPLLVRNHVTAVFHGHDHLFAKQELDGVVYQEVPQPGSYRNLKPGQAEEYGYTQGILLGGAGYLRVTLSKDQVEVEYARSVHPKDTVPGNADTEILFSYQIRVTDK